MSLHDEEKRQKFDYYSSFLIGFPAQCCFAVFLAVLRADRNKSYFSSFFWENVVKMFNQIFPDAEYFFYCGLNSMVSEKSMQQLGYVNLINSFGIMHVVADKYTLRLNVKQFNINYYFSISKITVILNVSVLFERPAY